MFARELQKTTERSKHLDASLLIPFLSLFSIDLDEIWRRAVDTIGLQTFEQNLKLCKSASPHDCEDYSPQCSFRQCEY